MHKIMLDPDMQARQRAERGGSPHVIKRLDPRCTAHIVVDMQNGFMEVGAPVECPAARDIVPDVNRISRMLRDAGGTNVFLLFTTPSEGLENWSTFYERFPAQYRAAHQAAFERDSHYWQLWSELDVDPARDALIELMGLALVDLGRGDEALRRAAVLYPEELRDEWSEQGELMMRLEAALWGGRPQQALELSERLLSSSRPLDANLTLVRVSRAWALHDLGREPEEPVPAQTIVMVYAAPPETTGLQLLHRGENAAAGA